MVANGKVKNCQYLKRSEIWDLEIVTSMWGTFSFLLSFFFFLVFKIMWGHVGSCGVGALGHCSHECLMSLRGYPKDCVVHGNFRLGLYGRRGYQVCMRMQLS